MDALVFYDYAEHAQGAGVMHFGIVAKRCTPGEEFSDGVREGNSDDASELVQVLPCVVLPEVRPCGTSRQEVFAVKNSPRIRTVVVPMDVIAGQGSASLNQPSSGVRKPCFAVPPHGVRMLQEGRLGCSLTA